MAEKMCPRCGREAAADQAFCAECLAEMEKYPVKPGVVVLLPPKEQPKSSARRRYTPPSPEEQVAKLKKRIVAYRVAFALVTIIIGSLAWLTLTGYFQEEDQGPLPGQNYSAETVAPAETE